MAVTLGEFTIKRLYLPTTEHLPEDERAWVDVKDRMQLGDMADASHGDTITEQGIISLSHYITAWNYTEADGSATPITTDTVRKLDYKDFLFLTDHYNTDINKAQEGLSDEEKKASTSISVPVKTEDSPTAQESPTTT